jgi:polysaccharide biosynthesis/export protein
MLRSVPLACWILLLMGLPGLAAQSVLLPPLPGRTDPAGTEAEYRIGPDDLLEITVFEYPDMNTSARVTASGRVTLPLLGVVEVAALTPRELEIELQGRLRDGFLKDPHVTVFLGEYGSQPVSVVGAVRQPDIYQIRGRKFLLDMIALAGGLDDEAGKTIQILRRNNTGALETIEIDTEQLFVQGRTDLNLPIRAGDTINVPESGSIFVVGEVDSPGEFPLRGGRNVTVTQALALGGGLGEDPKESDAFITRLHLDGTREEIPVDLDKVIKNEAEDVVMQPNDVLFVPGSPTKKGLKRALDAAVQVATSRLIWR